jgi:uncharacterized protein (TIGR03086 family)
MNTIDIRELDRRAVERSISVLNGVKAEDLARPTPCAGWSLADLLRHMTAQHHGFAAASQGRGAELDNWRLPDPDSDPVADHLDSARQLISAFAAEGVPTFTLPEFSPMTEFPANQAIGFHFIDYVVHGWDVARSLGQDYLLDDDLAPAAVRIALAVPNGPERLAQSAAFAPARPVDPGQAPLEQILRALGRDPGWPVTAP